jgi:hypothetical protein
MPAGGERGGATAISGAVGRGAVQRMELSVTAVQPQQSPQLV